MKQEDFNRVAERTVLRADAVEAVRLAQFALDMHMDILQLVIGGYSYGLEQMADKFDRNEITYPQFVSSGQAAVSAIEVLSKSMQENHLFLGTVVTCSIGDSHSAGKDLCSMLLMCSGFDVVDLGSDVRVSGVISAIREKGAKFVVTSATTTGALQYQKELEEAMVREGLKGGCLTCVGGAACSEQWAKEIGADIFSSTFSELLGKMMERIRKD